MRMLGLHYRSTGAAFQILQAISTLERETFMPNLLIRASGIALMSLMLLAAVSTTTGATSDEKPMPEWSTLQQAASRHLTTLPGYQQGDMIVESNVMPIFDQFRQMGWNVTERRRIQRELIKDSDFIARKLRTKSGKKFMRDITKYPDAYDRLYRIAALSKGRAIVSDLIAEPAGHEMIEYLTTSKGGKNMGKMLARAPKGAKFNKPTGRIFTEKQLLARLQECYARDLKAIAVSAE